MVEGTAKQKLRKGVGVDRSIFDLLVSLPNSQMQATIDKAQTNAHSNAKVEAPR